MTEREGGKDYFDFIIFFILKLVEVFTLPLLFSCAAWMCVNNGAGAAAVFVAFFETNEDEECQERK